jgi:2-keto-3-deoxy-L-rhamnonate aldolase RhmA
LDLKTLSRAWAIPGQYDHPRLREADARVRALCKERGIAIASVVNRPESIKAAVESGSQFLLYGTDLILMRGEAQRAAEALAPLRKERDD